MYYIYTYRELRNESVKHTAHVHLHSHLYIFNSIINPYTIFFTTLSNSLLCYSNIEFCSLSKTPQFLQAILWEILHQAYNLC